MKTHIENKKMKILLPVPLNAELFIPMKQAIYFSRKYGAEITVLSVLHNYSYLGRMLSPGKLKDAKNNASKKLKRIIEDRYGKDPVIENIKISVETGDLVSTILSISEKINADLIIIKKAKRISGRKRFLKQENSDRLIANSACPVLTIYNKHYVGEINKILLPVDILKKTDNKINWAKSLAKSFGAEIQIISIFNMNTDYVNTLAFKKGRRIETDILNEGINAKLLLIQKEKIPLEDHVLKYAKSYKPDLLLIMTHQENILFSKYLGSFASEIIHKAKMPVLSMIPARDNIFNGIITSITEMSVSGRQKIIKQIEMNKQLEGRERQITDYIFLN